ncbi:transposable element Tcb2 transposase [Trichonephila clavipes]|nr:transposable element Tcb2 transposase [Trichonephila clavipes]
MLGRRIAARQPPLTCLPELWRALLDEWCNIPQDQIDNLILSMPRRCSFLKFSPGAETMTNCQILCQDTNIEVVGFYPGIKCPNEGCGMIASKDPTTVMRISNRYFQPSFTEHHARSLQPPDINTRVGSHIVRLALRIVQQHHGF